jgi:formylglycine-generating enzyme required for sulfatase activity
MNSKNYFSKLTVAILFLAFGFSAKANNLTISGTSVSGSNITFDISWDNSWNASIAPANWDAVWVFVKYQDCNSRLWAHAGLSTVAGDHTAASPLQVDPVTDGKGVFIRRSALGGGNISATSITLKMTIPAGTYNYKVLGVEMVNVPQGAFEIGDATGASTYNSISVTAASQSGGITAAAIGGTSVSVPSTFPVGYNAFYCMKYEITQEQYVDFLNCLTYDQQRTRTVNDPINAAGTHALYGGAPTVYRNGIIITTPGNNATIPAVYACDATVGVENNIDDGQNIPCNLLNWGDLSAYLDWAALRPMTELEFEKVCRGTMSRVAGEYPWGTTAITAYTAGNIANSFRPNENVATVVSGPCMYNLINILGTIPAGYGPSRSGIFATGSSGRAAAGASYYGAMDMGGNVWERTITTANTTGTAFTGNLGDGSLNTLGDANQTSWPPLTAVGAGFRGGDFYNAAAYVRTSDRGNVATVSTTREVMYGGRGVR